MDNMIMIIAGDAIEANVGLTLGISTLCAAGFGNLISGKNDEFCIKNDEFCIENGEFCMKNDDL